MNLEMEHGRTKGTIIVIAHEIICRISCRTVGRSYCTFLNLSPPDMFPLMHLVASFVAWKIFPWRKLRIGFFPHDCPRDEILPVMSKIWAKLVECGSDIHKRKSAVQLLYAEILILATGHASQRVRYRTIENHGDLGVYQKGT